VETLIVARLIPDQSQTVVVPTFKAVIKDRTQVNSCTQTIQFEMADGSTPSLDMGYPKGYYSDIKMIGKHFRVSELKNHKVHRHYTIA